MKKIVHVVSGYISAFSFLLSFFLMAGIDGDYALHAIKLLAINFAFTFAWCVIYYVTSANKDWLLGLNVVLYLWGN